MAIAVTEGAAKRIRIKKAAEKLDMTPKEYILEALTRDFDAEEKIVECLEAAHGLVEQAAEGLKRGDLRQASEKIWGACALAIRAHALAKRGRILEFHRDLWLYKNEVAKELGDWVRGAFLKADSMHKNFYEGLATREDVEDSLREVEKLVSAVSKSVEG